MRVTVRNIGLSMTHLADVESTTAAIMFGVAYRRPPKDTKTLCGLTIWDGVVMQDGTKLHCKTCRNLEDFGV